MIYEDNQKIINLIERTPHPQPFPPSLSLSLSQAIWGKLEEKRGMTSTPNISKLNNSFS